MCARMRKKKLLPVSVRYSSCGRALLDTSRLKTGAFALSSDEVRFILSLVESPNQSGLGKSNLWVYRPHQAMRSGDFVIADLSCADSALGIELFVVELKRGVALKTNGRCSGMQLVGAETMAALALAKVHAKQGCYTRMKRLWKLVGDRTELLRFFGELRQHRGESLALSQPHL